MKQLGHASQIIPLLHPQQENEKISEEDSAALLEVLSRQFSHPDGIRGFFAVYLTSPESLTVDEVPDVLAEAVRGSDASVMVPLACKCFVLNTHDMVHICKMMFLINYCTLLGLLPAKGMNVIMPTAMSSIHKDAELKECAAKTASNGKKILSLLKGNEVVVSNCKAILSVCQDAGSKDASGDLIEVSLRVFDFTYLSYLRLCKSDLISFDILSLQYWEKFFANYKYEDEQKTDIAQAISEFC